MFCIKVMLERDVKLLLQLQTLQVQIYILDCPLEFIKDEVLTGSVCELKTIVKYWEIYQYGESR